MTPEDKERLRAFWVVRCLTEARRAYVASGGADPMYLILDAAYLATPLFPEEPYYQRVTPVQPVGAIIDEKGFLRVNAYLTNGRRINAMPVCSVKDLVDNLERLADALKLTDQEYTALRLKVRAWITHDDREGQANMAFDRLPGVKRADPREIAKLRKKAQAISDAHHKPKKLA